MFCIKSSCLNIYFVYIEIMILLGELKNVSFVVYGLFRGGCFDYIRIFVGQLYHWGMCSIYLWLFLGIWITRMHECLQCDPLLFCILLSFMFHVCRINSLQLIFFCISFFSFKLKPIIQKKNYKKIYVELNNIRHKFTSRIFLWHKFRLLIDVKFLTYVNSKKYQTSKNLFCGIEIH